MIRFDLVLLFHIQSIAFLLAQVVGAITQLILRGNGIHSLAGLEKLYAIEALDLAHNVIGSLSEVARLGRLPSLTRLWLEGNPIELRRKYRAEVLGLLQDGEKVRRCPSFLLGVSLLDVVPRSLFGSLLESSSVFDNAEP